MEYYVKNKIDGSSIRIESQKVIEQLKNRELPVGAEFIIFGTIPHLLKVIKIEPNAITLESAVI